MNERIIDLTNKKIGRLTVIRLDTKKPFRGTRWVCICDCGKEIIAFSANLRSGHTTSCGCSRGEFCSPYVVRIKHGYHGTPEYRAWKNMKQRCLNPKCTQYPRWGGRGIKVCARWIDFENFIADMGPRPGKEYSIDRINNDGDYEPTNCRWATSKEQNSNKRNIKRSAQIAGQN